MKCTNRHFERDGSGHVKLTAEDSEDVWHVYNLINKTDRIKASTIRRIQTTQSSTGSTESHRMRLMLTIRVETVDFDTQACTLRINGTVIEENPHVQMGAYHTIDLEQHRAFTLWKDEWDSVALDRIKLACDVTQRAEVGAICMQDGLANICLITENMTVVRQKVETSIPRKRMGSTTQHDKAQVRFYEQVMQAALQNFDFDLIKCVIVASPGFTAEAFFKYLFAEAIRTENRKLLEAKSKFMLIHSSTGHKDALAEVLQDPAIQRRLADTKYAKESKALEDFFRMLNDDPDRAFYGWDHVRKAGEIGAIGTLLLTDGLFRSADIKTRRMYIRLVEHVKATGAKVYIFSSLHVSGEQLQQLTGVAAILTYPAPHIEDEIEEELAANVANADQQ